MNSMLRRHAGLDPKILRLFVSYSQKDLALAKTVHATLRAQGVAAFLAEHDVKAGQGLAAKITQAIDQCDIFVLLWSKSSQESNWVRDEVSRARVRGKYILPVLLEAGVALPPSLGDMKYVSAHENFQSALAGVQAIVAAHARHKAEVVDENAKTTLVIAAGCLLVLAALAGEK